MIEDGLKAMGEASEAAKNPQFVRYYAIQHSLVRRLVVRLLARLVDGGASREGLAKAALGSIRALWDEIGRRAGLAEHECPAQAEPVPMPGGGEGVAILVDWGEPPATPLCRFQLVVLGPNGQRLLLAERSPHSIDTPGMICEWLDDGRRVGHAPTSLLREDFLASSGRILAQDQPPLYKTEVSNTDKGTSVRIETRSGDSTSISLDRERNAR